MKSVGEIMAIGTSFEEAIQKGLRMLQIGANGLTGNNFEMSESLLDSLENATDKRIFAIVDAFEQGIEVDEVYKKTFINPWFLNKIKRVVNLNQKLKNVQSIDKELLIEVKKAGFSAKVSQVSKKLPEDKWLENFITDKKNKNDQKYDLKKLSINKLKTLLSKLVSLESYEKAALVRDELSKRKS